MKEDFHARYWGCLRKEQFGKTGAEFLAKKRRKKTGEDIRAYKCLYCEFWHIGHHRKKFEMTVEQKEHFELPPPELEHQIQRIYERACSFCWEEIPHSKEVHGYEMALYALSRRTKPRVTKLSKNWKPDNG